MDTMIGVDLAKPDFQVHGASMAGRPQFHKKLSRLSFPKFMAEQPSAIVERGDDAGLGRLHRIVLVVYRRCWAGEIEDLVNIDVERETHVVPHELES